MTLTLPERDTRLPVLLGAAGVGWVALWWLNERVWDSAVSWLGLDLDSRAVSAAHFFLYDTTKIFLLLEAKPQPFYAFDKCFKLSDV